VAELVLDSADDFLGPVEEKRGLLYRLFESSRRVPLIAAFHYILISHPPAAVKRG
jgi:hypothetical protein